MDSLSISRRYDKFLDKTQHREAKLSSCQVDLEQPRQKEMPFIPATSTAERSKTTFSKFE